MNGITHRSVGPDNLFVGPDGHLVLSGFAHASVSRIDSPKVGLPSSMSRKSQVQLRTQATNTTHICVWSAPELVLGWGYDAAVDCWGFAATLFFMLTGQVSLFRMQRRLCSVESAAPCDPRPDVLGAQGHHGDDDFALAPPNVGPRKRHQCPGIQPLVPSR